MRLRRLLSMYLLGRLLGSGRGRTPARHRYGRGRRRGNVGFFGPFPTYSTRTRRGSRVTVSGCCLPIPLALVVTAALGTRAALRR
jgi:hypothetical protein